MKGKSYIMKRGDRMKTKSICTIFSVIFVVGLVFSKPNVALALFSVSARPYEGGFDLRYGKISPASGRVNQEIDVAISSDISKQYRLVQTLLDPLSTPDGRNIPSNSFFVYGIRGSNKYGTLNVEQDVPVSLSRQIIYTSNQTGSSDSLILVYGLILPGNVEAGSYRGRIAFTLEAIDSTQEPQTTILNIFLEVETESAIEITTSTGSNTIQLRPGTERVENPEVAFEIKGNFGSQFRISQDVTEQPSSADNEVLDWQAVNFAGSDAKKGMAVNEPTPLSDRQQIIYTSSPRGEQDSFVIKYSLSDSDKQKAGTYRTRLKYILEGASFVQTRLLDTLDLIIDIPRIFDLEVIPEYGGVIQFRDVKPLQLPKINQVTIEINSNIGKKYQLTQKVLSELTTAEGFTIPDNNFTVRTESLETKGILKVANKQPVKKGDMVLFVSDENGASDKFKIIYELSLPADYHAGDYSTKIVYSLSEI